MRKLSILLLALLLAACRPATTPLPAPSATAVPPSATPLPLPTAAPSATAAPQPTATLTPQPDYPPEGYGPSNFPAGVNPLTGLESASQLLERRPLLIKVENLPRNHRPQFGLSRADLVFEYYTEEGSTRFAALFYGQDAEKVAPIRSARYFDIQLVQMYRANLVFGGAYEKLWNRLVSSAFGKRLLVEGAGSCPALCRFDPNGSNLLMADTSQMGGLISARGIDNARQPLDGMFFQRQVPAGGSPGPQLFVRFSGAIYNRWDYDAQSGRYLRFSDAEDDVSRNNEVYAQLTDRLSGEPVAADNLVVILAPYLIADPNAGTEVLDVRLEGSGPAYLWRDGQVYALQWRHEAVDSVLSLVNADGTPFPLKPGQTWFEVMGSSTQVEQNESAWRFQHIFP